MNFNLKKKTGEDLTEKIRSEIFAEIGKIFTPKYIGENFPKIGN